MALSLAQEFPRGFDPAPTVFTGGLDRMIRIWESCRDENAAGYASGVVQRVTGLPPKSTKTVCSPFTATVIGMMFDSCNSESPTVTYKPMYDDGKRSLGSAFYAMHNGFFFSIDPDQPSVGKARRELFSRNGLPLVSDSAESLVFFNLGYQIDPRDMRRGDFVAIDWSPKGGHATFCWDVHVDASGAVDSFLYLSSNGSMKNGCSGYGVSVGTVAPEEFIERSGSTYKKKQTIFKDDDRYIRLGHWLCLPGVTRASVLAAKTFKTPVVSIADSSNGFHLASLRVVRFWGFAPPAAPHGSLLGAKAERAQQLTKWYQPDSYATGASKGTTGTIEHADVKPVPRTHPDPLKATPPTPKQQDAKQVVPHQGFVEHALGELHDAGWIDRSPGASDSVADGDTKAAVRDFQTKLRVKPIDGIAGPITRAALQRALEDLHAGKPNPNRKSTAPVIEHFYWLANRVDPGGTTGLVVHGQNLDLVQSFEVELIDKASGRAQKLPLPMLTVAGRGVQPVALPQVFGLGSVLTAHLRGIGGGGKVDKASDVPLYVGPAAPPPASDWPWDESKWPPIMHGIVGELRATPRGAGNYHTREITQYGVKEKILPGDTPVFDQAGRELGRVDRRSLFLSDIEGTMRLGGRILNIVSSGNVYDQEVARVIGNVTVKKPKPSLEKFDPSRSRWVDVTDRAPWGAGAKQPLIPFRTLAHNPRTETPLYGRKVYIQQLDGLALPTGETHNGVCIVGDCGGMAPPGAQFDWFVGREDRHLRVPTVAQSQGGALCLVEILGDCAAARKKG